jgi:hypothetical protein
MNGLVNGHRSGDFTYVVKNGSSVVDYVLLSRCLYSNAAQMRVLAEVDSKHLPVEFIFRTQYGKTNAPSILKSTKFDRYIWDDEKRGNYISAFNSDVVKQLFSKAYALIETNINDALFVFHAGLKTAASCMHKVCYAGRNQLTKPWFDYECKVLRSNTRFLLRLFKSLKTSFIAKDIREEYANSKKMYKSLLKQKRIGHKHETVETLRKNIHDSKKFWGTIKMSTSQNNSCANSISIDEWFRHFKNVFNDLATLSSCHSQSNEDNFDVFPLVDISPLNAEITENEVGAAISALKQGKAAGLDGISGEFYKFSSPCVTKFLTVYFNKLFNTGSFPISWCEAIIHPLHKRGDTNDPDNYRGISLLNISGKIYSSILNKRMTEWVEANEILNDSQAGFRKGYSAVDHMFTLMAVVQKQLTHNQKLYAAFVDFSKAFDMIDRNHLWLILRKRGIQGKMYRAVKSMYEVVKARVRTKSGMTDAFSCPRGVKQGESCSPILFSIFINELADEITRCGKHGITLAPSIVKILILLFADDVVLMSHTVVGLQRQLNILNNTANRLGLSVNKEKTKIVVFRNGGIIGTAEKWFYNGQRLEVVNQYKYLGVIFSTRLAFSHALNEMSLRAKKGVFGILRFLWSLNRNCPKLFFKMFDCQIQPILTYGCEIWALSTNHVPIERVHLLGIKRLLNVSIKTPTALIYCESGRYPIYISTYCRCIRFWLKLTRMENNRLPKLAYNMLLKCHYKKKVNWVSNVCATLYKYGFGVVWENQGVEQTEYFIKTLRQRLYDYHLHDLNCTMLGSERYAVYNSFRQLNSTPHYLHVVDNSYLRKWLTRIRLGVSNIKPHQLRFSKTAENFDCPFCKDSIESEFHFILTCPMYDELRRTYIAEKYHRFPNFFTLAALLQDSQNCHGLAIYLAKAFDKRSKCLRNMT